MSKREPQPDRCAVVHQVDGEVVDSLGIQESLDHARKVVERVLEGIHRRLLAPPESRVVGGEQVVLVTEVPHEVAEHVGRGRIAVKEEDGGRVHRPCLPVEDVDTVDVHRAVTNGSGCYRFRRRRRRCLSVVERQSGERGDCGGDEGEGELGVHGVSCGLGVGRPSACEESKSARRADRARSEEGCGGRRRGQRDASASCASSSAIRAWSSAILGVRVGLQHAPMDVLGDSSRPRPRS